MLGLIIILKAIKESRLQRAYFSAASLLECFYPCAPFKTNTCFFIVLTVLSLFFATSSVRPLSDSPVSFGSSVKWQINHSLFSGAMLHQTNLLLKQEYKLALCSSLRFYRAHFLPLLISGPSHPFRRPPLPEHLVWSSMPNGLTARPVFQLCQQNCCSISYRGGHFRRDCWVAAVAQAGQLEGIWTGITSTSPPALSWRWGGRAVDRWQDLEGERAS